MGEAEKIEQKDYVEEPLWYLDLKSRVRTRNEIAIWGWMITVVFSFGITYGLGFYLYIQLEPPLSLILTIITLGLLFVAFYISTRLYLAERGLDIDRFFWVAYYCGVIGLESERLSKISNYNHNIYVHINPLRFWLWLVSRTYKSGDDLAIRTDIRNLSKRLKYLPKFIEKNKGKDKLPLLSGNFLMLGRYINSKHRPRIATSQVNNITSSIDKEKMDIKNHLATISSDRVRVFFIALGSALIVCGSTITFLDLGWVLMLTIMTYTAVLSSIVYFRDKFS